MRSAKNASTNRQDRRLIQILFRLTRDENLALFDYLAACPRGTSRTARLKLLAHEGLRALRSHENEAQGQRPALPVNPGVADHAQWPSSQHGTPSETQSDSALSDAAPPGPAVIEDAPFSAAPIGTAAEIFGAPVNDFDFAKRIR